MNTSTQTFVQTVAAHLEDLPEAERRELLEDLEHHVAEVAAEGEGTLEELLGSPAAYARELRVSAGLPRSDEGLASSFVRRAASSSPARWMRRALQADPVREVRGFLPELRPAWWVGRAYLGVLFLDAWFFGSGGRTWDFLLPVPQFGGASSSGVFAVSQRVVMGFAAILAAVWVSVALGRRAADDHSARVVNWAANGVTVVLLLMLAANPISYARLLPAAPIEYVEAHVPEWLQHPDGAEISNICAYDSRLRPLERVLLYDQDGRPISNTVPLDYYGGYALDGPAPEREITNAYPRSYAVDPRTGSVVAFECPTLHASEESIDELGEEDVGDLAEEDPDGPTEGGPGTPTEEDVDQEDGA